MNSKFSKLIGLFFMVNCFGLLSCISPNEEAKSNYPTAPWLNSFIFDQEINVGETLYDVVFEMMFVSSSGDEFEVKNCYEVFALGDSAIAQWEFARWEWLKSSCLGLSWYYRSPETAISYWGDTFNLETLKTFPSAAMPYFGGQGSDGRVGNLGIVEPELTLIKSNNNSVKVRVGDMVINYVVLARADFNRDGYQDMFVRMDWTIENSFGEGFDWAALTKISPNMPPMLLWRK